MQCELVPLVLSKLEILNWTAMPTITDNQDWEEKQGRIQIQLKNLIAVRSDWYLNNRNRCLKNTIYKID